MSLPRSTRYDAVVIGAGLIGLSCAWRARERGLSVLVVDRAGEAGAGASGVAAGMLAPVTEADFGEEALLRANLAGARALAGVRRRARGGHRAADRLPRERRARGGRRPRRRGGAPPPARVPALARARRRVAHAVALPGARARPVAAHRRRHRSRRRTAAPTRARPCARSRAARRGGGARRGGRGDRARRRPCTGVRGAAGAIACERVVVAAGAVERARWRRPATARRCGR